MAGARTSISVSATIGVAMATLLVVGGILAGPAILDCSKDSAHFGACLRDKVSNSGLIGPEQETIERPALISEVPPDTPPIHAEASRAQGWIEANATEYPGSPAASAVLSAPGGWLIVDGSVRVRNGDAADAALTAPAGKLSATGRMPVQPAAEVALTRRLVELGASGGVGVTSDGAGATLAPSAGRVDALGRMAPDTRMTADVALAARDGSLDASGSGAAPVAGVDLTLVPRRGAVDASGTHGGGIVLEASIAPSRADGVLSAAGNTAAPVQPAYLMLMPQTGKLGANGDEGTGARLQAEISPAARFGDLLTSGEIGGASVQGAANLTPPPPPVTIAPVLKASIAPEQTVAPAPVKIVKAPVKVTKAPAKTVVAKAAKTAKAPPPLKYDPRYPNVVVLPAPAKGKDSSFATLQLN
ncbi:MAG: hypothetical protein ABIQ30_04150 [Devosia sp.]